MKRISLGLGLVAVLVFGSLQLAGADTKSINDPEGDAVSANLDIVKATAGHQSRKLKHTIKVAGNVEGLAEGEQILLQISTDKDDDCERELIYPPAGKRHIVRCGVGNAPPFARIQANGDTLKMTLKKSAIGSPGKYRWRIESRFCVAPGNCEDVDLAPDGGAYVVHDI